MVLTNKSLTDDNGRPLKSKPERSTIQARKEKDMPRLLLIDNDFDPKARTGAEETLRLFIEAFKSAGYEIGPSNFAGCTKCPDGDFGLSVYNPDRVPNDRDERYIFNYPSADQPDSEQGNMFFAVDAAFDYFLKFVTEDSRWNEIDAVVIDIMMPAGTLLPAKYRRNRVNESNAGEYLKRYLKELVAEYRIPQNPDVILPVLVLTNMQLTDDRGMPFGVNKNGKQPEPRLGAEDRLWVWNMEKIYARNYPEFLVKNLNEIVAGRVK